MLINYNLRDSELEPNEESTNKELCYICYDDIEKTKLQRK